MKKIFTYENKLVEEIGYATGEKVIFFRYVKDEDMPKCRCGLPQDIEMSIIENCPNWKQKCKPIDTIK